jgi:hypothetical protein
MSDWKEAVVRVTNNLRSDDNFGSGFVFHRDASGRSFVMTCQHVVDSLLSTPVAEGDEPPGLLVSDLPADVSIAGDRLLDLAVLEVDGLDCEPLTLADTPAVEGTAFWGAGFSWMEQEQESLVRRQVTGLMRDRNPVMRRFRARRKPVYYWDLSIDEDLFRELKPGYSGGPLLHRESGLVVGIFNLRRDKQRAQALCVESQGLLEPPPTSRIPGFSAGVRTEVDAGPLVTKGKPAATPGRTAAAEGGLDWLAGTIDHVDPIREVEERIGSQLKGPGGPGLWFCAVEGRRDDLPRALAIHLAVELGAAAPGQFGERRLVTRLSPGHYGANTTWQQLLATQTSEGESVGTAAEEEERILGWINSLGRSSHGLHVIYTELDMAYRRHIPGMIRGAIERLSRLGGVEPRVRLLFLYGLARERDNWIYALVHRLERLLGHHLGRRLALGRLQVAGCDHLGGLRPVTRMDLETWLDGLTAVGPVRIDVDTWERLEAEFTQLFASREPGRAHASEQPPSDAKSRRREPPRTVRYRELYERALPILRKARPLLESGRG